MMKKGLSLLTLIIALAFALAACGSGGGSSNSSSSGDSGSGNSGSSYDGPRIGMVTDTGGVNDNSFNEGAWNGLQALAKEHGMDIGTDVKYLESSKSSDYIPNLKQFARMDYDLVFAIGFKMASAIRTVAKEYPDQKWAIIDAVVKKKNSDEMFDNVASITFKEQQGSFLAGVVAAKKTDTGKIGFIGGVQSAVISRFQYGYLAGAKTVNPDITIFQQYAGSFADASKGKQIASTMYEKGADVIFHAAGATGNGVFTEAKNRASNGQDVWVIGVDTDQYKQGQPEGVTLTSMVKHVNKAIIHVSEQLMKGKFPGGEHILLGLEDGGVGLAKDHRGRVSDKTWELVKQYKKKIINGKIEVPGTKKEYKKFKKNL